MLDNGSFSEDVVKVESQLNNEKETILQYKAGNFVKFR